MDLPPVFSTNLDLEKRITIRLKKYWDLLRDDRNFPAEREISSKDIKNMWDNCFIVKADNSCKKEDYKYKYLGSNIIKISGSDLTGLKINSLKAPEAGHLANQYEKVLATKLPVFDDGTITLSKEEVIKYRQILLPLGDDGVNITSILGGMSYRIMKSEKRPFFLRFGSKK